MTFPEAEYQNKKRKTRRELFLERMDKLTPWKQLEKKVAHYQADARIGRCPYAMSVMLRVGCAQLLYNLNDPAMEDALHEIEPVRHLPPENRIACRMKSGLLSPDTSWKSAVLAGVV